MSIAIGEYLLTEEVAKRLGVTRGRVHQFVMAGRLKPARKIGMVLLFEERAVEQFAAIPRPYGRPKSAE